MTKEKEDIYCPECNTNHLLEITLYGEDGNLECIIRCDNCHTVTIEDE